MRRKSSERGLTLIEVVITVGLLMLLAGALFALISSVLESRAIMTERVLKQNRLIAWDHFLRDTLSKLERETVILTEDAVSSGIANPGYRIRFINATLKLGPYAEYTNESSFILETVKGQKGAVILQLIPYPEENETGAQGAIYPPLILFDNISQIRFEFYNAFSDEWSEEWLMNNQKPHAIKNQITLQSGETHEMIVWIPHA
ncbi:MAG: prepilin-type N-terminal cleavage/methylation domain-containing protein [Verrucomicrobiota bacterium]